MTNIKFVTPEEMKKIIDTRYPRINCYTVENNKFIACFNEDCNAWTEEFKTFKECINYLIN